jgi:hypothetical protein
MFHAFIVACAVNSFGIDESRCVSFEDAWGPYQTEENCNIRANQMAKESVEGDMSIIITMMLGYPPAIYSEGYCQVPEGEQI